MPIDYLKLHGSLKPAFFLLLFLLPIVFSGQDFESDRPTAIAVPLQEIPVIDGEVMEDPVWMGITPFDFNILIDRFGIFTFKFVVFFPLIRTKWCPHF